MSKTNFNSTRKRRRKSRGRYASAALCIAAVAIALCAAVIRVQKDKTSITTDASSDTVSSQSTKITDTSSEQSSSPEDNTSSTNTSKTTKTEKKENNKNSQTSSADEYEDFEDSEQTLAIQTIGKADSYIRPVGGAITKDYSMSGLVYSRTMGDWRVHNGLDISAGKGEIVKSASEGVVAGITEDPMYGVTVVINQNDGLMVYYRGLSKDTAVRQGENIAAGTTIGTVGDIPCENGDGSHLHVEVMKNNKYLNPTEVLGYK